VSTTGEKINAGKVLSCVYLLLDISPSSPNPNSGPPSFPPARRDDRGCFAFVAWEKGNWILLLPSPRRGRGAGGEGLSLS